MMSHDEPHNDPLPPDSGGLSPSAAAFEQAIASNANARFVLRLFVTGMTPRSQQAIENLRQLCQEHLPGRHDLEIIDIYQQPGLAKTEQVIAAPTLVKKLPLPLRRVIGDMGDPGRILMVLGITVNQDGQETESR